MGLAQQRKRMCELVLQVGAGNEDAERTGVKWARCRKPGEGWHGEADTPHRSEVEELVESATERRVSLDGRSPRTNVALGQGAIRGRDHDATTRIDSVGKRHTRR